MNLKFLYFLFFLSSSSSITFKGHLKSLEYFPFNFLEYIEINFCLDERITQCFELILDLNDINIILFSNEITKNGYKVINLKNNYYQSLTDKTINKNNITFNGKETNNIYQIESNDIPFFFILINKCSIDLNKYQFSGFFGLSLKKENKEINSLIQSLKNKNLISKKNIEIKFKSYSNIEFILDSNLNKIIYKFCPLTFSQNSNDNYLLSCTLNSLIFTKNKTIINTYFLIDVAFDSFNDIIQAPEPMGYDLFKIYMEESNGKCIIKSDNIYNGHYIECDSNFDLFTLSTISLNMSNIEIELNIEDIFDLKSKKSKIYIIKYSNMWVLNVNILKHYNLFIDYDNYLIGFEKNNINYRKKKFYIYIFYLNILCIIILLLGLFLNIIIYLSIKKNII